MPGNNPKSTKTSSHSPKTQDAISLAANLAELSAFTERLNEQMAPYKLNGDNERPPTKEFKQQMQQIKSKKGLTDLQNKLNQPSTAGSNANTEFTAMVSRRLVPVAKTEKETERLLTAAANSGSTSAKNSNFQQRVTNTSSEGQQQR